MNSNSKIFKKALTLSASFLCRGAYLALVIAACVLLPINSVFAQDDENKKYDYKCVAGIGCALYDPNDLGCAGSGVVAGTITAGADQIANAKIVIGIAKTLNLGQQGALIGLMVGLTESGLKNYANTGVPVSMENPVWLALPEPRPLGRDHDSVGIMQQRPTTGWSTFAERGGDAALGNKDAVWQLMNPAYAAQAFFGSPPGANMSSALSKGLQNKPGWQTMAPWLAAQAVQASGFSDGSNYKEKQPAAQSMLNEHWNSAPAIPLPVPLTGAPGPGGVPGSAPECGNAAVDCNASAPAGNLSQVRKDVVCIAQQELARWESEELKPGNGYFKYSQSRQENWCADFASWVYNQARYPLREGGEGNVAAVEGIQTIGEQGGKFKWHAVGTGYVPRPGDLAIHQIGQSHVNIVTAVNGNKITVIGGNQGVVGFTISSVTQYDIEGFGGDGINGYVTPD